MLAEYGQLQHQTAERFQETIVNILQSFAGVYGEQLSQIRRELDQIRRLAEQQQTLRSAMDNQNLRAVGQSTLRLVTGQPATGMKLRPASAAPLPFSGRQLPQLALKENRSITPAHSAATPPSSAGVDLHGQIVSRIARLQEERQGCWQNLLKSLIS